MLHKLLIRGRQQGAHWKGAILARWMAGVYALAYRGWLPSLWRQELLAQYWENNAASIHEQWGSGRNDYAVLGDVLLRYRPYSLLDAGCGSGRLFPLYQQCGVLQVVSTDISTTALDIAHKNYPEADLRRLSLTDLSFPDDTFDFCVCNRVLQHVSPQEINTVVANLARISRWVYINELTQSDQMEEAFFMRMYNYEILFNQVGMVPVETGLIGKQTYTILGRSNLGTERR